MLWGLTLCQAFLIQHRRGEGLQLCLMGQFFIDYFEALMQSISFQMHELGGKMVFESGVILN